ncbi:MAG: PAS domain-containing protein, partial [Maribacter sp.]|nr:PAS domain-containing protein [Maribacter sp.]
MNIRRIFSSLSPYKLLLGITVFLLFLIASISYKQIKNLQKSADLVSHSLIVDKEINTLFSYFNALESMAFRSVIVRDSIFPFLQKDYTDQVDTSLAKLYELTQDIPAHQKALDSITLLKDSLFASYSALSNKMDWPMDEDVNVVDEVKTIATISNHLRQFKTTLTFTKSNLLQERLAKYSTQTTITHITSLLLALFSLGVFLIAFRTIDSDRKRIASSEGLLKSVLRSTDNIMNYYEPILDKAGKISNFKIVFANECNKDYLGLNPEEITGKAISEVFPLFSINGEFNDLVRCVEQEETIDLEQQISVHGQKMWFLTIIKPLSIGVLVTARNNTSEREAEEKLRLANESLINKYNELETTQALLHSVLQSTKNVIMSFEPILDRAGVPTDFNFRFINERIIEVTGGRPENIVGKKVSE